METGNDNSPDEIIVHLDPLIQKIVPDFLRHRRENADSIWDALENSDFESVANIAHDIVGTAGAFGFSEMAQLGHLLQEAALESSHGKMRTLASELTDYLDRLRIVYN